MMYWAIVRCDREYVGIFTWIVSKHSIQAPLFELVSFCFFAAIITSSLASLGGRACLCAGERAHRMPP